VVCRSEYEDEEDCSLGTFSSVPSIIFVAAFFMIGVGNSVYNTLGISYLDDNIRKNKTPLMLGIKMLGWMQDGIRELIATVPLRMVQSLLILV
jgi:hypothetical protein